MKRPIVISIILFLAFSLNMSAQGQFRKPLKSQKQGANLAFSNYTIGLKLGCPWSVLADSELTEVAYSGNIGYNIGIVAERYFPRLSIGIEGIFSQKGTKMYYDMPYQVSFTENGIYHKEFFFGYNLVSVRTPLTYYFKGTVKDDKVVPYVFIAPQVDIPLHINATLRDGKLLFENPPTQTTITTYGDVEETTTTNLDTSPLLSVNALAGVGLMARIPTETSAIIIKFDIAANYGLRNLAEEGFIWKQDPTSGELVLKENTHTIRSHDVEANLTIIFPIKKRLHDACYIYK